MKLLSCPAMAPEDGVACIIATVCPYCGEPVDEHESKIEIEVKEEAA